MFISKITLALLILQYSILSFIPSCHASTNLALGKSYMVSPLPSYPLSAPPTDRISLTDGKYTVGYFWTQKTTVGWHPVKSVEILIDLEKVSIIGGISFSTARYAGVGVHYPVHISAYVGEDKEHFLRVGDIVDTPENKPGEYQTKRFLLDGIGAKGRYVLLEIITPKSMSVFCDEIEVLEGKYDKGIMGSLTIEAARNLSEQTRRLDIEKEILAGLAEKFKSEIGAAPKFAESFVKIKKKISTLTEPKNAESIETEILKLRGEVLAARFPGQTILLESVNAWTLLSPVPSLSGIPLHFLSLSLPQGGYGHAALLITNLLSGPKDIFISMAKMMEGAPEISIYQIPFIKSAALEFVADPLVPANGGFTLRSGESRMVFVTAEGKTPGRWEATLNVTSGRLVTPISIKSEVLNVALPKKFTLHTGNWGYLTFKPIRDRKVQAVRDLFAHHTNVIVVPPVYLRGANQYQRDSKLTRQANYEDFFELESYLKYHKGAAKILLGVGFGGQNHTTAAGKYPFMSQQWREEFKKWYLGAIQTAARAGFIEEQVYLYPYDEMAGKQIEDFVAFASWVRQEIPSIKLYATINDKAAEKALPYLDVVQVSNIDELLGKFSSTKAELWIYDTKYPAKSLSPYVYYRLMPWKAFLRGYKGIGFWAYAETGGGDKPGTAWDDFDGETPDFAVIYEGEGTSIVSSRRWEAWRMGIEDHELLTMYAKAKGDKAAKKLAMMVLDHPEDTAKADDVRRKILTELSETK
jgi:hypothetical protein